MYKFQPIKGDSFSTFKKMKEQKHRIARTAAPDRKDFFIGSPLLDKLK